MADIKTILRETSVATIVGLKKEKIEYTIEELYVPSSFLQYAKQVISGELRSLTDSLNSKYSFSDEEINIINNGNKLANVIFKKFQINKEDTITWEGNNVGKEDPIDIQIGEFGFSLKEESFILGNIGLYKLVNTFTESEYKTRHIFKDYAYEEYAEWFSKTWEELVSYLNKNDGEWRLDNAKGSSSIIFVNPNNDIKLSYTENGSTKNGSTKQCILPKQCSLSEFEKKTVSILREKVFSKFIHQNLKGKKSYEAAKRKCAEVATNALATELRENLNYSKSLPRFLRIHEMEYYYAKTTNSNVEIYRVPSLKDFVNEIEIESIESYVPESQANILTTIINKHTQNKLILRNECRFAHGQFNGTPEAKLYYHSKGSLEVIYQDIVKSNNIVKLYRK
jgi:hypothetical protein